ncbi:MAG: hypothetical protein AB7S41_09110 [Parvibaculaceae bacterium]
MLMRRITSWDELLAAFRALGGTAENVVQREGPLGRGIHPIDPARPVRLHVPKSLLIPESAIEVRDGGLRVKGESVASPEARDFFETYHAFASWGGGGEREVLDFLSGIRGLPAPVASALRKELSLEFLFEEPAADTVRERFLKNRSITSGNTVVAMPMVELVNHSPDGVSYDTSNGVTVAGRFDGEVLVRYNLADTYLRFVHYGFVAGERFAFSLPMGVRHRRGALTIQQDYDVNRMHGDVPIPLTSTKGNELVLSHALLGDRKNPYAPRAVFQQVVQRAVGIEEAEAQELFDQIVMANRMQFLKVLAACEEADGPMVLQVRRMCRLQLEALSSCLIRRRN